MSKKPIEPIRRGPKMIGDEKLRTRTFRCSTDQEAKLTALGGAAFIRAQIDAAPWPRGTKPK